MSMRDFMESSFRCRCIRQKRGIEAASEFPSRRHPARPEGRPDHGSYNIAMSVVLLCARKDQLEGWRRELPPAMRGETIEIWPDVRDPAGVDIALAARVPQGAWATLPRLRLVASLWAGVDRLIGDPD